MTEESRGQVDASAAEVYERFFLPALFKQWPPHVIRRSGMAAGDRVLDVACGTGVLARAAQKHVGRLGAVVGLDRNDAMLAVAARKAPEIEWRKGRAESLPFDDASFDCVVSEFGLMFFEDRRAAVAEMLRVLRPGKRAVVAVWASIDESPGYAALARLLAKLFGMEVARELEAPFCLGEPALLRDIFARADGTEPALETVAGECRFPSLDSWITTEIKGWTLAGRLADEAFERLQREARSALSEYVRPDGSVAFDAPARLVTLTKR